MKRLLMVFISTASAFFANAQTLKKNPKLNLNFETVADSSYSPAEWRKFDNGYTIKMDLSEKYEGNASLLIQSNAGKLKEDSVGFVLNTLESKYIGREIEMSGYLKFQDVSGRVGFCIVVNGKNGPLAVMEMTDERLNETKPWDKYSIKLPFPDSAVSITFSVFLYGTGKLWADKIRLLVDSEDITKAAIKQQFTNETNLDKAPGSDYEKFVSEGLINSSSRVSPVPAAFLLDAFYKKYLNANGIPIIGSEKVADAGFYKARDVIDLMLRKVPALRDHLISQNARVAIIAKGELTTDLPEYRNWDRSLNNRARGFGGTIELPLTSVAEENILCLESDRYHGEDILVHEFAHTLRYLGIAQIDTGFNDILNSVYLNALQRGLWRNTYAISNPGEYFAEGVQTWFNVNKEEIVANGIHNSINTKGELKVYDRELYDLIDKYFSDTEEAISCSQRNNKYSEYKWRMGF